MSDKIKLADLTATNAWQSAGLGDFDADSNLAEEIDANHDGEITAYEITQYEKSQSNDKSSNESTQDNLPTQRDYSVVDLKGDTDNLDTLKDEMQDCVESFKEMDEYIESFAPQVQATSTNSKDLTSATSTLANKNYDGTGSGKTSAYSLTLGDDASTLSSEDLESTNVEATTAENNNNQKQINSKNQNLLTLNNKTTVSSGKLSKLESDMSKTDASMNKILNKVGGGSTSTSNASGIISKACIGTGIGIYAARIAMYAMGVPLAFPYAMFAILAVGIIASFFGMSAADKKKAEIRQLGQQAQQEEDKVQKEVDSNSSTVGTTEDSNEDSSTNLTKAQTKLTKAEEASKEQANNNNNTTNSTTTADDKSNINNKKDKKTNPAT